jgi:hypothetical protein
MVPRDRQVAENSALGDVTAESEPEEGVG